MTSLVLVVDDSPMNLELVTDVLEGAGYTVAQAGSGRQAIDMAAQLSPDAILMDIGLPDIDGYAALSELRLDNLTRNIPVAALTAYAMEGDEQRALAAGFDAYITKPIKTRTLVNDVEQLISQARKQV